MSSSKKLRLLGAVSVFAVAAVMPLYAASQDFNDVAGVPFIKGTVLTCRSSDFEKTVFEGNDNYSVCRLKTDSLKDQGKIVKTSVLTRYPAVLWGCFSKNELGGVPIDNKENGRYSDYNRSITYAGNCAVVIRVNYQHGGKCYPHFEGDYFEVFQSNHLSRIVDSSDKKNRRIEYIPCQMNDVPVLFEFE